MSSVSSSQMIAPDVCQRLQNIYLATAQNALSEKIRQEIESLPVDIKQNLFWQIGHQNGRPTEHNYAEIDVLDNPELLQKTIRKVSAELFLEVDFSEDTSPYKRLLNIYQAAEYKNLSETTYWEIILLPQEVAKKIFCDISNQNQQTSEYNFRDVLILDNAKKLQQSIANIANQAFLQLNSNQQSFVDFQVDRLLSSNHPQFARGFSFFTAKSQKKARPSKLLKVLDEFKELLSSSADDAKLIAILKKKPQLLADIPHFISNLDIQHQSTRMQIAKLFVLENHGAIAEFIQSFGIQEEADRIELAILSAEQNPITTALCIQNFDIKEQAACFKIARLCTELNFEETAKYIPNFGISEEENRIKLAQLCAKQDHQTLARFIKKFQIQSQDALFELALSCAQNDGSITASEIRNFGIEEEIKRIELAKICYIGNYPASAYQINQFAIQDQTALIDIAKICAQQCDRITPSHIHIFGIKDERSRIEIAKLCAEQNAQETAEHIRNFYIQDEAALIEIAVLCAQQDGKVTAECIKKFGIQNEKALIQIAMLCAQQNGQATALKIHEFEIYDPTVLRLIHSSCVFSSPNCIDYQYFKSVIGHKEHLLITTLNKLLDPIKHLKREQENQNPTLDELKKFLLAHIASFIQQHLDPNSSFLKQAKSLEEIHDLFALQQASSWMASMLFFLVCLDQKQQELINEAELLKGLLSNRSPILRQNLSQLLIKLSHEKEGLTVYADLLSSKRSKKKQDPSKDSKLLDLILASLQISGVNKEVITSFKSTFYPLFKGHIEIRPLLETLYLLDKSLILSPKCKENLLIRLCKEPKDMKKQTLFALQAILLFKKEEKLQDSPSIQQLATAIFQEKLRVNISGQSFLTFQERFMTNRNPNALITYAAKLFLLNDIEVKNDLSRYVNRVLQGTFSKERYQLDNNPHLQKLAEYHPDLLLKWQTPLDKILITFSSEEESSFDPASWLQDKMAHGHMKPNQLPHLGDILEAKELEENSLLDIEKALKDLLKSQDKAQQIAALEEVAKELQKLPVCAFIDDVKAQLDLLNKPICNLSQEVSIVDTDDYQDLLLCGTEVVGSCQNVNGQPRLNKGLLGYILDGKNRLIAVKDKQGRIMARAKLSILWDSEKPALYLERLYTQGKFKKQCLKAIQQMALAKAQQLDIPLTAAWGSSYCHGRPIAFGKDLQSLGGASYEYVDALRGPQKNGIYQIHQALIALIL